MDPHFFDIFSVSFIKGDSNTALAEPNTIVLTRSMALKYFGDVLTMPALLGVVLFIEILAGVYPALFLSAFDPAVVLKSETFGKTRKSGFRNALVVFQFTVSIVLIVGTFIVNHQLKYIHNKNLGLHSGRKYRSGLFYLPRSLFSS